MDNAETLKAIIKEYRRKVEDAEDDVAKGQRQLRTDEKKLDSLEDYQEDCLRSYQSLEDNPFNHARRREFKLLLDRLEVVIEEQRARIQSCLEYIERSTRKLAKVERRLQQYRAQLRALKEAMMNNETADDATAVEKATPQAATTDKTYAWLKTGKY